MLWCFMGLSFGFSSWMTAAFCQSLRRRLWIRTPMTAKLSASTRAWWVLALLTQHHLDLEPLMNPNLCDVHIHLWGQYPFDMHTAAQQLENLSYGIFDRCTLDVSWWGWACWKKFQTFSNTFVGPCPHVPMSQPWGLCITSVLPLEDLPCRWRRGWTWKLWGPKHHSR